MHECQRVYSDKLVDDKDSDAFTKIQTDALKKFFDVSVHNYTQTNKNWIHFNFYIKSTTFKHGHCHVKVLKS